jgi:hypothetical protein
MNITELTPPPVTRKFSIEFTENELKALGIIVGNIPEYQVKDWIINPDFISIPPPPYNDEVENMHGNLYDKIVEVFTPTLL